MKNSIRTFAVGFAAIALSSEAGIASAAEISVLSTIGVQSATREIVAQFERASGHKVTVSYGLAAVLRTQYLNGEAADVVILTKPVIEDLMKQGKIVTGSNVDIARSGIGIAVKAGAPKPDISTPEALKRTLLAAKSIAYSKEGAGGTHVARVIERLGIAEDIKPKWKDAGGKAGEMLAKGEVEIGAQQIPELMAASGIDIVGPLPGDLQLFTIFTVGLDANAKEAEAAKALIKFLSGPDAAPIYKANGLAA
jgi:molybdate transport system substrate-binding protein